MEVVLDLIHIIGIISFSAAGAMVAVDNETDTFGVVFLSIITCFGGGLLRDIIAGQAIGRPLPVVLTDMNLELIVCIFTALAVFFLAKIFQRKYVEEEEAVNRINNILDALGIGVFTAAGTEAYLVLGPLVAIVMGVISSVGGSMTRDVILGHIPQVLRKRIYVLALLAGSVSYYVTSQYVIPDSDARSVIATVVCVVIVFAIRMCATYFKWNMPKAIDFAKLRAESEEGREEITK